MNYIDIILIVPLLWAAYRGFTKGLIIEVASLAALILGIWGAIKFSWFTSELLVEKFEMTTQYLHLISFSITFVAIVIAVHLLARVLDKLAKLVALGLVVRVTGAIFGVIKIAFVLSIILVIINTADRSKGILPTKEVEGSLLYKPISGFAPSIFPYLQFENIKERINNRVHEQAETER
jgi:membrane protein required for colicin V production